MNLPLDLMLNRFPKLGFMLSYEPPSSPSVVFDSETTLATWKELLSFGDAEVLYLFGIGPRALYRVFKPWLRENKRRRCIFLEEDLSAFREALNSPDAEEMIQDPQVHLEWVVAAQKKEILQELIDAFSSPKIAVIATPSYLKRRASFFRSCRLYLLRKTAVSDALLTEALYSHALIVNVLSNLKQWEKSFFANGLTNQFRGIPAVICGAGPSLSSHIPLLQTLSQKALLIAGGSAIAALSNRGVSPHLSLALDPNPDEYQRLKIASAYETPLIYGTRVEPHIFHTTNASLGYLHSFTGGPCENYFEKEFSLQKDPIGIDLGSEAFSVTTLSLAFAVALGCDPIILTGVDLAYTGMRRYAEGILPSSDVNLSEMLEEKRASEQLLSRKGIQGKRVYTLVKWVMESECIGAYAQKHPSHTLINVSVQGLGFPGIPNVPLEEVIEKHCKASYDLQGMIHAHLKGLQITTAPSHEVVSQMEELQLSLQTLKRYSEEILAVLKTAELENQPFPQGKLTLLQMDFEEEKAFDCFLSHVGPALDHLLNQTFLEEERMSLKRQIAKWEQFEEVIEKHEKHLSHQISS